MDTQQQYTNYAFISYKREDEKWAKWLQRKLENYKLPSVIRKESPDLPKYIRPVFRDGTDLTGGVLIKRLHEELMRSKYLIVICSPNVAKSDWVNKEVLAFIDAGRQEHIIPFIISGTPHAHNISEECFPAALLDIPEEEELLGINIQELGRNMAFVRLVATMLNIRFDTLWQRHRRNQIRNRIITGVVATLAILVGLFVWDYNRATYSYYADYVDRWGVPEGVVPLTDRQVSHRNRSYQFEYRRIPFGEPNAYSWRLEKVSHVNSALCPQEITNTELKDRYPIQEIEYNKNNGVVSRINFCDVHGKVLLRHVLSERDGVPATVADFVDSQEQKGTAFVGAELTSMSMGQMDVSQRKSNIVRYVYERNADGYIVKQTFHSNNDYQLSRSAVCDADGIFGCTYTLDSLGRRIKVAYINIDGTEAQTKKGIAGKVYEYDAHGIISKATYISINGKPISNEFQWAICFDKTDNNGNIIEETLYNAEGKPCFHKDGYAKWTAQYDERGNQIETAFYDTEGKPCFHKEGFAKWNRKHDERGNCIEEIYYDTEGKPCFHKDGFAKCTLKYDERGNQIETTYYDTEGNLCISNDGFAKWTAKYDERGNQIEIAYYDTEGNLCISNYGYAKWTAKYDERGNQIETAYYDTKGNLCFNNNNGYAKEQIEHDERGNIIKLIFYGVDSQPCFDKNGVCINLLKYDEYGNIIESAYYGPDGKPCNSTEGAASWKATYEKGFRTSLIYYDTEGNPCMDKRGINKWVEKHDAQGNLIEQSFYNIEGKLCYDENGVAKYIHKYDECGNMTETTYYNPDGNMCFNKEGVARFTVKYDKRGNRTETACYDTGGDLCISNYGYTRFTVKYDERGNRTETAYYDTEGNLCISNDGIAKWTAKYDERGNQIETAYYDTEGNLCISNDGIAKWTAKYDERGNQIEIAYYNANDKLCLSKDGMAKIEYKYDKKGNCIERSFYGVDGNPCVSYEGIAMFKRQYDIYNNVISTTCYNEKHEKSLCNNGFASILYQYDVRRNRISTEYRDVNDKPVEVFGYYKVCTTYNDRNMAQSSIYYNAKGEIISNQVTTRIAVAVSGLAAQHGLPVNSVFLQWNDWKIGDAGELLNQEMEKSRYGNKKLYFITPDGNIMYLHIERGLAEITYQDYQVEQSQADKWKQQLEAYKRQH